jgi:hypothetical protein
MAGTGSAATFVRFVLPHERTDELVREAKSLTYEHYCEFALVEIEDGRRVLLHGGAFEIELIRTVEGDSHGRPPDQLFYRHGGDEVRLTRLIFHTHPKATGPSDGDCEVLRLLGQSQSMLYELFGDLDATRFRPKGR